MNLYDKSMSAEERFRKIMEEHNRQDQQNVDPVKIIFPDGREVLAERFIAYIDSEENPGKHTVAQYGSFTFSHLMDAKKSLNKAVDEGIKKLVGIDGLNEKLRKAGLPGVTVSVGVAAVPKEVLEQLMRKAAEGK